MEDGRMSAPSKYVMAVRLCKRIGMVSPGRIQRELGIGYEEAWELVNDMVTAGIARERMAESGVPNGWELVPDAKVDLAAVRGAEALLLQMIQVIDGGHLVPDPESNWTEETIRDGMKKWADRAQEVRERITTTLPPGPLTGMVLQAQLVGDAQRKAEIDSIPAFLRRMAEGEQTQ
jgi:hypothetical protein